MSKIITKESDQQPTPEWIVSMFEGWYDPCPLDSNPTIDGLLTDWRNETYVNPP